MKKIISLTKVLVKEFYQNLAIFNTEKKKLNKKSVFFWLIAIVFLGITYLSYEIIKFLAEVGQEKVFLNLYFFILSILLLFQTILVCTNIFFFSKDIEKILHMPLKPVELLLGKFNTLLCMLYITEGIFRSGATYFLRIINPCVFCILSMGNLDFINLSYFISNCSKYNHVIHYEICKIYTKQRSFSNYNNSSFDYTSLYTRIESDAGIIWH